MCRSKILLKLRTKMSKKFRMSAASEKLLKTPEEYANDAIAILENDVVNARSAKRIFTLQEKIKSWKLFLFQYSVEKEAMQIERDKQQAIKNEQQQQHPESASNLGGEVSTTENK